MGCCNCCNSTRKLSGDDNRVFVENADPNVANVQSRDEVERVQHVQDADNTENIPKVDKSPYVVVLKETKNPKVNAVNPLTFDNAHYTVKFGTIPSDVYLGFVVGKDDTCSGVKILFHAGIILCGNDYIFTAKDTKETKPARNYLVAHRTKGSITVEICTSMEECLKILSDILSFGASSYARKETRFIQLGISKSSVEWMADILNADLAKQFDVAKIENVGHFSNCTLFAMRVIKCLQFNIPAPNELLDKINQIVIPPIQKKSFQQGWESMREEVNKEFD